MTDEQCEKQIQILREVTKEALKSKESALQYLIDAGIVRRDDRKGEDSLDKKDKNNGILSTISNNWIS